MATEIKTDELEKQLEALLDVEKFPPPEDFRKDSLVTDESMYEEAERDLEGFWARQAEQLVDWIEKPTQILDESNVPFYKWFADGKLNLSYNCLDRHVEAGNGDRVAYHWRGEGGEERDITYAELHRDVQRFANAVKDTDSVKAAISSFESKGCDELIMFPSASDPEQVTLLAEAAGL